MRHIPNILSVIRIVMIPFFINFMLKGDSTSAATILAASGISDLVDGFLARRFNWVSDLGKVLDPVADKLTQITVCVVLIYVLRSYWLFFILMLLKEVVMMLVSIYLLKKGVKIDGARWFGKAATVCFYVSMTIIVLVPSMPASIVTGLICVTTALVLFAFAKYIPLFFTYKGKAVPKAAKGKE